MRRHPRSLPRSSQTQGVVLIVVLVLLVAIAFMSVSVMRSALSTDLITNNNRTQSLATEMAQLALRFCEDDLTKVGTGSAVVFTGATPIRAKSTTLKTGSETEFAMAWEAKDNWVGNAPAAHRLSQDQLKSSHSAFTPGAGNEPQCLAEYSPDAGTDKVIVVTARGFSPDYIEDDNNRVRNGSVVWLQSRILLSSGG